MTSEREGIKAHLKTAIISRFGRYPVSTEIAPQPFFVIGSGRSGNTLFRKLLMGSNQIYIPPETYELGRIVREFQAHSWLEWRVLCHLVLSMFSCSEDFEAFPTQALRPLYRELLKLPQQQRSLATIVDRFFRFMAEAAGRAPSVWGDKTPLNVFFLPEIEMTFPEARYIHIHRDGYDVVASYLEMGRYTRLEEAAERWVKAVRLCRDFGRDRPGRFLEISYERLVRETEEVLGRVCNFLDVEYTDQMLAGANPDTLGDVGLREHHAGVHGAVTDASIGKGRRSLGAADARTLEKLIGNELRELGYEAPASGRPG